MSRATEADNAAWRAYLAERAEKAEAEADRLRAALRNVVASSDANDGGSLANAIDDARAALEGR